MTTARDAGRTAHAAGMPIDWCPHPLGSDSANAWRFGWNMAEIESMAHRDPLLTPGEVAHLFRVDPKTVVRWAKAGRLPSVRTPGGHRRFRRSAVMALMLPGDQSGSEPTR